MFLLVDTRETIFSGEIAWEICLWAVSKLPKLVFFAALYLENLYLLKNFV